VNGIRSTSNVGVANGIRSTSNVGVVNGIRSTSNIQAIVIMAIFNTQGHFHSQKQLNTADNHLTHYSISVGG
jgi:hypothetical protein